MTNRKFWQHCGFFLCCTLLLPNSRALAQRQNAGDARDARCAPPETPGEVLKKTLRVSAGGPYATRARLTRHSARKLLCGPPDRGQQSAQNDWRSARKLSKRKRQLPTGAHC